MCGWINVISRSKLKSLISCVTEQGWERNAACATCRPIEFNSTFSGRNYIKRKMTLQNNEKKSYTPLFPQHNMQSFIWNCWNLQSSSYRERVIVTGSGNLNHPFCSVHLSAHCWTTVIIINMCNYRYVMSWTPDQSSLLSLLLDEVVGTQEMVDIRQDYCRLLDCMISDHSGNGYFTGSKAEGLNLPGSDKDIMKDVNDLFEIEIVQTLQEIDGRCHTLLLCTDNVPLGFALLQPVNQCLSSNYHISQCFQNINGMHVPCFSSDLFVQHSIDHGIEQKPGDTIKRQGPSLERWGPYDDKSKSGTDNVYSIHCTFWPNSASEWTQRPRHFGWPSSHDISSIIDFGCHLVPTGHPHSDTKLTEWRISFSVAERALVWSFNHIQMQCYAVMKIILKQFIKIKCSSKNFVLCSYFIKTFLFWKYETTDLNFWCSDNFRSCIKFLLIEFSKCIQEGILSHYFIPGFNLLSVKLTREAQAELQQIMDIAIQSDICIFRECISLQGVWSKFLSVTENRNSVVRNRDRENLLITDACFNEKVNLLFIKSIPNHRQLLSVVSKTHLKICSIKKSLQILHIRALLIQSCPGNKEVYQLHKFTNNDALSTDISTSKLWYAFYLLMRKDYTSTLNTVNQILSNIAPFALCFCPCGNSDHWGSTETKELYIDRFIDSEITIENRAKTGWLMPFMVGKNMAHVLPLAIQIELLFFDHTAFSLMDLSPFVCAYYIMFLCYHELHQYDNRNRALRQLVDVANNIWQSGPRRYDSYNIMGHCLFLAGDTTQAREFFIRSYRLTQNHPPYDKYNSALYYLQCLF